MNPFPRRSLAVVALLSLVLAVPMFAKRRAVAVVSPPNTFDATITGTVLDAVTHAPVIKAKVTVNGRSDVTDAHGKFEIRNVHGAGTLTVEATRTGYTTASAGATATATDVTINMQPLPTATLRLTNSTTKQVDVDSIKFGYFSGFVSNFDDTAELCAGDGTPITLTGNDMKHIIGPAQIVTQASCCSGNSLQRVTIETRNGVTGQYVFSDSCVGYDENLIVRDHVSGDFLYIPFEQVADLQLP